LWQADRYSTLGAAGEAYVAALLSHLKWNILDRNRRHIGYELDLVASKGSTLAIVEVKVRSCLPSTMEDLRDLLPLRKRRALVRGSWRAAAFAGIRHKTIRFDLALVVGGGIKEKSPAFQTDVLYFPSVFSGLQP